jgi:phage tail sheath protein FI
MSSSSVKGDTLVALFTTLPGVRIQEVLLSSPPIIGVSTSTAAFVGTIPTPIGTTIPAGFNDGTTATTGFPTFQYPDVVQLVTSADQFTHDYIGIRDTTTTPPTDFVVRSNDLTRAVYGFFANGGTACYVVNMKTITLVSAALALLEVYNDISIVAVPGKNDSTTYSALKDHVEKMLDRFAILDPPTLTATPSSLTKPQNSEYTAIYYPRVTVSKQLRDDPASEPASPSGHIAGVYARVDANRGVFKAPANETLLGVLGVEQLLSDDQQNQMNAPTKQVNALRVFSGNVVVFGARTTSDDTLWLYINVRRLVIYIEQSLKVGLRWAIFEPNNLTLQKQIARSAHGFLDGVWRDGALFGATAEEAYYVRFPPPFNRDEDRAQGKLTIEIGLRVTYPAEFIIIRIGLLLQAANSTT